MSADIYTLAAVPPAAEPQTYAAALQLLVAISDPKAAKASLEKLAAATATHKAAAEEVEERLAEVDRRETSLQSRLDAEASDMARARAEHEKRLVARERECDERLAQRERDLASREKAVAAADKEYVTRLEDLDRRMNLLRQAGAA
jgi:hypothetical protein